MADQQQITREALVQQAIQAGFSPAILDRSPIYSIQAMLAEVDQHKPSKKKHQHKQQRGNRAPQSPLVVHYFSFSFWNLVTL